MSNEHIVKLVVFQSARPVRGGTILWDHWLEFMGISIRPPRAGRDSEQGRKETECQNFNPPAPCGAGRGRGRFGKMEQHVFQSARPVRGGTRTK